MANDSGGFASYLGQQQQSQGSGGSFPQQGNANYNFTKFNQDTQVPGPNTLVGDTELPGGHRDGPTSQLTSAGSKGQLLQSLLMAGANNPDAVLSLQQQLIKGGYLNPRSRSFEPGNVNPGDATYYAAEKLFNNSIVQGKDYQEILAKQADRNPGAASYAYFEKKFGVGGSGIDPTAPIAFDRKITDLSTPLDAQAIINNTFETFHGRKATESEVNTFTQALAAYQHAHPTETQGSYDPTIRLDKNSTTSGGMSGAAQQQFADNFAQSGDEQQGANSHSLNQYVDAFSKLISGGQGARLG